jgi:hypothetical protein
MNVSFTCKNIRILYLEKMGAGGRFVAGDVLWGGRFRTAVDL